MSTLLNHPTSSMKSDAGRSSLKYTPEEYSNYIIQLMENLRETRLRGSKTDLAELQKTGSISSIFQEDDSKRRLATIISVDVIHLYAKENAKIHHTDMFDLIHNENPIPIFRRGQPFYMAIRFKRDFDFLRDHVVLELSFGPHPQATKGTLLRLVVEEHQDFTKDKTKWDVRLHNHLGSILSVFVKIPASVPVGMWRLKVITYGEANELFKVYEYPNNVSILFNPWCKEDTVYMEQVKSINEYILNESGKIYVGTHAHPRGRRWIYGQFSQSVLPACMLVLEHAKLDYPARANPVRIVRAIANILSAPHVGVMQGNWAGDYKGGISPSMWSGSSAILESYLASGGKPVQFGQCWVFAGVTTTICRALGIPARTVTNYVSAHDTDDSLTVDFYFDKNGDQIIHERRDSVWNYHVWNECWMKRHDLPEGYGGWQAVDSTPHERSEGIQTTGPTSVIAIRNGHLGFLYDSPFMFAEVNAEILYWKEREIGRNHKEFVRMMSSQKYHPGRDMLTQKRGADAADDEGIADSEEITDEYKDTQLNDEERMHMLNVARYGGLSYLTPQLPSEKEDVTFNLVEMLRTTMGELLQISMKIENRSSETRTVEVTLSVNSVFYTGVQGRKLKMDNTVYVMQPDDVELFTIKLYPDEYLTRLVEYCHLKVYAMATVNETEQTWIGEEDFVLEKPLLELEVIGMLKVGIPFQLRIEFKNPISHLLIGCRLTIEGPGIIHPRTIDFRVIQPKEYIVHTEEITPFRAGSSVLAVVFNSREICDLTGSIRLDILP